MTCLQSQQSLESLLHLPVTEIFPAGALTGFRHHIDRDLEAAATPFQQVQRDAADHRAVNQHSSFAGDGRKDARYGCGSKNSKGRRSPFEDETLPVY